MVGLAAWLAVLIAALSGGQDGDGPEREATGVPIVQPIVPFGTLLDEYPQIATSPQTHIKLGADL